MGLVGSEGGVSSGPWADPHRPIYHFTPDRDRYRINDPNGLIQWKGRYHLFYQYNPHGPYLDGTGWGHAVSDDLVHWEHLPMALEPTPGGPDAEGCYSGCAVNDDGVPTVIYTGIDPERPCLATGDDTLVTWEKHPGNPVIDGPPQELEMTGFRDHSIWREGSTWYQVIGAGIKDVGGDAFLYSSEDLLDWEYLGSLMAEPLEDRGTMWECPDFFTLGERHVLLVSRLPHLAGGDIWRTRVRCYTGEFKGHKFAPEQSDVLDAGGNFYAPQTMVDDSGRRLMWGWITEGRSREAQRIAGWTGVISLPRVLDLDVTGRLVQSPAGGTEVLRGGHHRLVEGMDLSARDISIDDLRGDSLEIRARFEVSEDSTFGVRIRCSPDGAEQTTIEIDPERRTLTVDRTKSSLDPEALLTRETGSLGAVGKDVEVRIFLDRSVIEVFANGSAATSRVYPMRADSLGVIVFATGGGVRLKELEAWEMVSIS